MHYLVEFRNGDKVKIKCDVDTIENKQAARVKAIDQQMELGAETGIVACYFIWGG